MLINRTNFKLMLGTLMSVLFAAGFSTAVLAQATVDQVTQAGEKRADQGAAEQQRVEQVADQTDALLAEYKTVTKVCRRPPGLQRIVTKAGRQSGSGKKSHWPSPSTMSR